MKCEYFKRELDEERQTEATCSCELGYFEDEEYQMAIKEFCNGCEDRETDNKADDDEDD